jgi:purine-nucleoside phosphorylase
MRSMSHPPASQSKRLDTALAAIRKHTAVKPRVALVLGSGLGAFADTLEGATKIPYTEIPSMPVSGVVGHAGNLVFGRAEGLDVVAMQGRVHLYEGHPPADVVFGARLMIRMGALVVIITNAAGGANPTFVPGDLMLIEDHLNLTGQSSLTGHNDDALGPRFPDMSAAYDPGLRALALEAASAAGFQMVRGIYAGNLGPAYETPAEVRMAQRLGADAVGMSTVLETIAARHMGARVLGISCITNKAAGLSPTPLDHAEVEENARAARGRFVSLLRGVLHRIATTERAS